VPSERSELAWGRLAGCGDWVVVACLAACRVTHRDACAAATIARAAPRRSQHTGYAAQHHHAKQCGIPAAIRCVYTRSPRGRTAAYVAAIRGIPRHRLRPHRPQYAQSLRGHDVLPSTPTHRPRCAHANQTPSRYASRSRRGVPRRHRGATLPPPHHEQLPHEETSPHEERNLFEGQTKTRRNEQTTSPAHAL